ncbi:6-carboxytetrahydropterin synthase [Asticcacaulis sp. SL142]|uniref:6-pyruvoyl trahydropterin synthase family protein n=1 Tax=Asticcacaulis sp. SL142 TaxID=2995155 RepID=UPI00226C94CF|nr:6-carboxytetrahydropterin synthase [Asticcacaulis sp. SL142]WAC49635.1 6-carboxytetrahydropterin synthase [Asticcacaulis sp. SL142]
MPQIQFTRRFSMAHRLRADASSKCMTPHGHNEFVKVTLKAKPSAPAVAWGDRNYALSFEALKRDWHAFVDNALDHAFQLGHDDPMIGYFRTHEPQLLPRLLVIKGDPTTEAVAMALYHKLGAILSAHVPDFECVRFEIEETPTNSVILTLEDLAECSFDFGAWTHRPDHSINDLEPAA